MLEWLFPRAAAPQDKRNAFVHDLIIFILVFAFALALAMPLSTLFDDNNHFSMAIFILVVAVIARFTQGYAWGVGASILAVWCVNYFFTYPYWAFNLTLMGYPLNFAAMLIVSLIISALTTQVKHQARLQVEAELEKSRANLLRSVSHDIRTPLTSIIGSSSVLMDQTNLSAQEQKELAAAVYHDALWLSRLTENVLTVTKVQGGQLALRTETEVLEEIVGSAIGKFRKRHGQVTVNVCKPEQIILAPMDATLIEQVILNLMDNAVVHGVTTRTITITLQETARDVRVTIANDGQNIAPERLPHLFDGSVRSSASPADAKSSMGVGLSVCHSIITAHGGILTADPVDQGASFTFTLPPERSNP